MEKRITRDREYWSCFLFLCSQLGMLLSLSGSALGFQVLNSIGVWMIFYSIFGVALAEIINNRKLPFLFFVVVIIIIIALLSMLYSVNLTYKNLVSLFSFLEIPLLIVFTKPINSDCRIKIAILFAVLISFLYIYSFFSLRAHFFLTIYGPRIINELTLGFSNPNETGIHLVSCLFSLNVGSFFIKNKILKSILVIDSMIIISFIVQSLSRASLIICVLFLLLLIIVKYYQKIPRWVQNLCFLMPIFVFLFAVFFQGFITTYHLFGEVIDTGRLSIYLERFLGLRPIGWLIGDYSYYFQNSLNSYLSIFLTIGLPAFLLFLCILKYGIKTCSRFSRNFYSNVAFLGVLMLIVHSSVESANLVGGSFYAASFFNLYIMAIDGE